MVVFSGEWPGGDSGGVGLVGGDGVDGELMGGEWAGGESVGVGLGGGDGVDGEFMREVVVVGVKGREVCLGGECGVLGSWVMSVV